MAGQTDEQIILDLRVKYDDAINSISQYSKAIDELTAKNKDLKKAVADQSISQEEYYKEVNQNKQLITQYREEQRIMSKEIQNNLRQEISDRREQQGSLRQLRAELSNLTKEYDNLSKAEREGAKGQELKKHINDITSSLKNAEEGTQRYYRNVGNYENSIKNALGVNSNFANSLLELSKNGKGIGGIFDGISVKVKAFGSALLGLLSNPVFLAMAGIAGAGAAFKWFYDYNNGLIQATKLTKSFTGLAGEEMQAYRDDVQAVCDTMGTDFKDTLVTATTISKNFGIDATNALNLVKDGLIAGGNVSGDFLNNLKEYAGAFKDLGVDANQFTGIMTTISKQGMNVGTALTSIERGGFNLQKMSSTLRADLQSMGVDADGLSKKIQSGQMTTMQAMQQVAVQLQKNGVESQQTAKVMQDLFGKGAVALGSNFVNVLTQMGTGVDKLKEKSGELGKLREEQIQTQTQLNNTIAAMFDKTGGGFEKMKADIKLIATKLLLQMAQALVKVINWFVRMYNKSIIVRAGVQAIVLSFKNLWNAAKLLFNLVIDGFKGIGRGLEAFVTSVNNAFKAITGAAQGFGMILSGIADFSLDEVQQGVAKIKSSVVNGFKDTLSTLKNTIMKQGSEIWGDITSFAKEGAQNTVDAINETVNGGLKEVKIPTSWVGGNNTSTSDGGGNNGNKNKNNGAGSKSGKGGSTSSSSKGGTSSTGTDDAAKRAQDEATQVQKAEELLTKLIQDQYEQRREQINLQYDKQIKDLQDSYAKKGEHTKKAEEAITIQITALNELRKRELAKVSEDELKQRIETENKRISLLLEAVKKGSKAQYDLQLEQLNNQEQLAKADIEASNATETQKQELLLATQQAYQEKRKQLLKDFNAAQLAEQKKAVEDEMNAQISQATNDYYNGNSDEDPEITKLRLQLQARQELLAQAHQMEGESDEEFAKRKMDLENDVSEKEDELTQKSMDLAKQRIGYLTDMIDAASSLADAFGDKSKAMAKASKILALGTIAIQTGVAIAEGIEKVTKTAHSWWEIAAGIAITVTTVLANMAAATKTVKSAKFAHGGAVYGDGTATSDSIPARLSNGESVITAAATSLFQPALSAMNQLGGGAPIIVQNPQTQMGEDFIAAAVAKGFSMCPSPVVSVEEINDTNNRVKAIESLSQI